MKHSLAALAITLCLGSIAQCKEPLIVVKPGKVSIASGKATEPTVVTSAAELEKLVPDEAARKAIAEQVDLKNYRLIVFSWKGSGGDKIEYAIAESSPEQITFTYKRGLTRDLRPHLVLYAVRNECKWTVK